MPYLLCGLLAAFCLTALALLGVLLAHHFERRAASEAWRRLDAWRGLEARRTAGEPLDLAGLRRLCGGDAAPARFDAEGGFTSGA